MPLGRRDVLRLGSLAAVAVLCSRASAETYPARPVRMVVRSAAGRVTSVVAGLVGEWLSKRLAQHFIIESQTGAAASTTIEGLRCASPDGYTLLVASTADAINPAAGNNPDCDFIHDTPVAGLISTPLAMVVSPSFPADAVPAFIAYAKANPDRINRAASGGGSPPYVAGELFRTMAGVGMAHVAYRGDVAAITDLLAGQVQLYFGALPATIEFIRDGNLRALAVTGATRSPALPDVPAMAEFLPGYEATIWVGVNAPGNTAPGIVDKLNREINAALADAAFGARLARLGAMPLPGSPSDYARLIAEETGKWARMIRASGARVN
jgi:tripartite-type tricarboxylate transporter receptor subunit TctC